jgi:hypothetical protein
MMTWIARVEQNGASLGMIYQTDDGSFVLRRVDGQDEALSELEVRRFVTAAVERSEIETICKELTATIDKLGVKLPPEAFQRVVERTHKRARDAGLLRTGSAPNLTKFFEKS